MTVCVAARCADVHGRPGRAVVLAADRMVSSTQPVPIEAVTVEGKLHPVSDRAVVAIAGAHAMGHAFAAGAARDLADQAPRCTHGLVVWLAERFATTRRALMEPDVFGARGLTASAFYTAAVTGAGGPLAAQIDHDAREYRLGFELLVASLDDDGAHVHGIGHPGMPYYYDAEGFAVIGQGATIARATLIRADHTSAAGLIETALLAYTAVTDAAVVAGVGHGCDVTLLTDDGVWAFGEADLAGLAQATDAITAATVRARAREVATLRTGGPPWRHSAAGQLA